MRSGASGVLRKAEYAGYDDNGTPEDESDDNHLYYIRRYKLREAPVPLDNDGDMWENEDPVNGIDDDGDGFTDEDPEDSQPLRGASEGWIQLYYVEELQKLAEWAIPSLLCVEHETNDGLLTSVEGMEHSVLVKVPVSLMDKAGEYRFVISAKDSHADREKGHRGKWALERNQGVRGRMAAHFTIKNAIAQIGINELNKVYRSVTWLDSQHDTYKAKFIRYGSWGWWETPPSTKFHDEPALMAGGNFTKDKFHLALKYCWIVTFYGHGSRSNHGSIWFGNQLLTGSELMQTYATAWVRYKKGQEQWYTGLHGIKLVMLLSCWSGGDLPAEGDVTTAAAEPDSGSVAEAFRALGVEATIFTIGGSGNGTLNLEAAKKFCEDFWKAATKGNLTDATPPEWEKISVLETAKRVREKYQQKGGLYWLTMRTIHVAGDTYLAD